MYKTILLNLAGLAGLWGLWYWDYLPDDLMLGVDPIYMGVMVVVFLVAMAYAVCSKPIRAARISNRLIDLGLLGTVIGIILAAPQVSQGALEYVSFALKTTALGLIGYLWVWLNLYINGLGSD